MDDRDQGLVQVKVGANVMPRLADWRVRLHEYLAGFKPEGEEVNCAKFVQGAIIAMTGIDPIVDFKDQSPDALVSWTTEQGFETIEQAIASRLELIDSKNLAQVGDVALLKGNMPALGIVIGADINVLTMDNELGVVPLNYAKAVFRP